jgi:uncharacterized protein with ATP-grasp and redox domains
MPSAAINFLGETCQECLHAQSVRLSTRLIPDPLERTRLIEEIGAMIDKAMEAETIWGLHRDVYAKLYAAAGNPDPFLEIKRRSTQETLALYPSLKERVAHARDPLYRAVRYAIAGNVIDFALPHQIDLNNELAAASERPLAINHLGQLRQQLAHADNLLYLGDNAGETVLDRLLIETIGLPTTYIVRGAPVINDATLDDAQQAGLQEVATLLSSGSRHAGTVLEDCSPEVQGLFARASVIISKGMGNFESLLDQSGPIFFLLKVKCNVVANHLQANVGDSILLAANE